MVLTGIARVRCTIHERSAVDGEAVRLRTQQYMEPRLPQWRAETAAVLADRTVSDENAWAAYGRAAYLLVRDGFEMAKYGEIRTHTHRSGGDTASDAVAYRAPLLRQWRQDAANLLADEAVTDKEAFTRMSQWAYSLTAKVGRWRIAQHEAPE